MPSGERVSWLHAVFGWVLAEADKRDLLGGQGVQKRRAGESIYPAGRVHLALGGWF